LRMSYEKYLNDGQGLKKGHQKFLGQECKNIFLDDRKSEN